MPDTQMTYYVSFVPSEGGGEGIEIRKEGRQTLAVGAKITKLLQKPHRGSVRNIYQHRSPAEIVRVVIVEFSSQIR